METVSFRAIVAVKSYSKETSPYRISMRYKFY